VTAGGLLLTGGASRRFGSPKAELTIDGERLADRGARLLLDVCDYISVGMAWPPMQTSRSISAAGSFIGLSTII